MPGLADIFADVRLNLQTGEFEATAAKAADNAGATMGQRLTNSIKKSWSGEAIGKGFVQGLGIASAFGATQLLSRGMETLGDIARDSVAAFNEDQVSIQKLGTALKANIPNWDGNTDAIEKVLRARTDLGFSDDEQRESLAILVARTHDYTKALAIERAAMDLARLKGIGLAEASKAISLGMSGNGRALKELGINVKDYASETEILTAIQERATGQAEDYAATNEGKLLVSQVKVNEAMEKFGSKIAGPQADAMVTLANRAVDLSNAFTILSDGMSKDTDVATEQATSVLDLAGAFGLLIPGIDKLAGAAKGEAEKTAAARRAHEEFGASLLTNLEPVGKVADAVGDTTKVVHDFGKEETDTAQATARAQRSIRDQHDLTLKELTDDAQALIDGYFDPIETRAKLHDTRLQTLADLETLRNAKGKEEHRQASDDIIQDLDDEATTLATLGTQGKLTATDVDRYTSDVTAYYKAMGKEVPPEIQAVIDQLHEVAKIKAVPTVNVKIYGAQALSTLAKQLGYIGNTDIYKQYPGGNPFRARGGPVDAGMPYLVNEDTPRSEWFVPSQTGTIVPHDQMAPAGASTINVNLLDRMPARSVRDIGDGLRMLERRGYLGHR